MSRNVKLTTRGRYAVTTMVEIAKSAKKKPVPLSSVAQQSNISLSYLEQLIVGLRQRDLVKSYRGPGGGYILGRPSDKIVISEILLAAEDCKPAKVNDNNPRKTDDCAETFALWDHIGELLHATLTQVTLEDVIKKRLNTHPYSSKIFEIFK